MPQIPLPFGIHVDRLSLILRLARAVEGINLPGHEGFIKSISRHKSSICERVKVNTYLTDMEDKTPGFDIWIRS
jgi:hypothetical protein